MGAAAPQPLEEIRVPSTLARVAEWIEAESLLLVIAVLYSAALLVRLPYTLGADSWLTLFSGRFIREHGLPHHDALTVWAHGAPWVDQQWLAQLGVETAVRLGGVKLALLVHAALVIGAFALAAVAARRLGGSARAVALVSVLAVPQLGEDWELRAQSFAYALFIAVLWLLLRDRRAPGRAVLLCVPLLALWTNLHGSVLAGTALVVLRGVTRLRGSRRDRTALALVVFAPLAALASPYAASLPGYYERVLVGRGFAAVVTEWGPTTPSFMTASFYLLAFGAVALVARGWSETTLFERLALLLTLVAGILSLRNMVWFSLTGFLVLPRLLDGLLADQSRAEAKRSLKVGVAVAAAAVAAVVAIAVAARPASWFEQAFPGELADRAAATARANPALPVFADLAYADWLVWRRPELSGRLAVDARLELLTHAQLMRLYGWRSHLGSRWPDDAGCPAILLVDRLQDAGTVPALMRLPGVRLAYRSDEAAILVRGARSCESASG